MDEGQNTLLTLRTMNCIDSIGTYEFIKMTYCYSHVRFIQLFFLIYFKHLARKKYDIVVYENQFVTTRFHKLYLRNFISQMRLNNYNEWNYTIHTTA